MGTYPPFPWPLLDVRFQRNRLLVNLIMQPGAFGCRTFGFIVPIGDASLYSLSIYEADNGSSIEQSRPPGLNSNEVVAPSW